MEFLIPALIAFVLVLFVSRELWCWYLKINQVIEELQKQTTYLGDIRDELRVFRRERETHRKAA